MNGFQGDENAEKFCSKLWSISYVNLHAWNNTLSFILMQIGYDIELVFDIVLDIIILKMKDKNRLEPYWRYWHVMKASNNSERRKENSIIRFRILCSICPSFLTSDWVYTLQTHTLIDCHSCLLQTLFWLWVPWTETWNSTPTEDSFCFIILIVHFCVPAIGKYTASFGPLWTRLVHFTPLRITYLGTTLHQPARLKAKEESGTIFFTYIFDHKVIKPQLFSSLSGWFILT